MRILTPVLLVCFLAACGPRIPGAVWYGALEVVCRDEGCPRCMGTSDFECPPCGGEGQLVCDTCDGRGERSCGNCGGDGHKKGEQCEDCDGTGVRTCWDCGGDGWETCDTCSGKTRVTCTRAAPVRVPKITDPIDAWPPGNFEPED